MSAESYFQLVLHWTYKAMQVSSFLQQIICYKHRASLLAELLSVAVGLVLAFRKPFCQIDLIG